MAICKNNKREARAINALQGGITWNCIAYISLYISEYLARNEEQCRNYNILNSFAYPLQKLRAYRVFEAGGRERLKSCSGLSVRKQHLVEFCLVYFSFATVMTPTEQSLRHFIVLAPCTCEQNVAFLALPFSNGTITVAGSNKTLKHLKFKFLPLLQWLSHFNLISFGYINNTVSIRELTFKMTQNKSLELNECND